MDAAVYAGKARILFCLTHREIIRIRGVDPQSRVRIGTDGGARLFADAVRDSRAAAGPFFKIKGTVQPRRDIFTDHCRFNGNRPGAAERIQQRPVGLPSAEVDHGAGQRFLDRRLHGQFPVAPFMQAGAGGIERQERDIV